MIKKYKYYFKILNDELFGGEGSEGYCSLTLTKENDKPINVIKDKFDFGYSQNVKYIEISEGEYLKATSEDY